MSTNKTSVDSQITGDGHSRHSASGNNSDSDIAISMKGARTSVNVDEEAQSGGLLDTNEYQSITDEDQESSTKSSQPAAADAIPPESAAAVPVDEVPLADQAEMEMTSSLAIEDTPSKMQRKADEYIEHVLRCCDNGDDFDFYQLMAFHSNTQDNVKDRFKYWMFVMKASICAVTQILGMIIIMVDFNKKGIEERGNTWDDVCHDPFTEFDGVPWYDVIYESYLKILAFLFSTFLAFFCFDRLTGVEEGMYWKMKYAQYVPFLDIVWLRVGFSVNVVAAILAVYGSFLVVFFSENSLDMILNSVALFFVVELDDLLVKPSDYQRIGDYIREWQSEDEREKRMTAAAKNEEKCCPKCRECGRSCCSKFVCCMAWLYTLPFQVVRYGTVAMCVVLPFMVGYCY